jgi:SAM-dependent methyltransferase
VKDYEPTMSFGPKAAEVYDDIQGFSKTPSRIHRDATVALLEDLAAGGPVLELAIGTGWIALPLAARGIQVDGIELSAAMVDELRAKPGGEQIAVTIGDMADVAVSGDYRLIFVVANSLFNLLTQDDQVRCFENVSAHLEDDGVFLIEVFRPDFLYRLRDNQYVDAEGIEVGEVRLDVARHDPVTQVLEESHVILTPDRVRMNPVVTRYAWPSELDLMARIAGLRLKERWGGWSREPFTSESKYLVAVYGR